MISDHEKQRLLDKYREHMIRAEGGIFTKKARERLLGIARPYGGDETRTYSTFWNRRKTDVENALVDLDLFIQTAEKKRVDEAINAESLAPIVQDLFWAGAFNDKNRAEIAQLFIQASFRFLDSSLMHNISMIHRRSISEAIDLSQRLTTDIARGKYAVIE